jgi:hypothetical protein
VTTHPSQTELYLRFNRKYCLSVHILRIQLPGFSGGRNGHAIEIAAQYLDFRCPIPLAIALLAVNAPCRSV